MAESVPVTNDVAIDSSRLPLEIWEIIIDHVGDLRPQDALSGASTRLRDLRNCSLVCRDWSHWSRKRLVQDVTIKTFAALSKFKTVLSLPPQYTRYVRWVDIDPPFQSLSSESYLNQLVISISRSLFALRALSFTSTYISVFPDEVIEALSHLKRLSHLRFNLVTFKSANSLVRLLSKMPWITELTLRHISVQNDFAVTSESQNTEDHASPQLRAIEITHGLLSDHFQTVHRLIPDLPMSPDLKRFQYCGPLDRCSTLSISAFLQIKGSSIQELKLAAYFTTRPNFDKGLQQCRSLRIFELAGISLEFFPDVNSTLLSLRSPFLERLAFQFDLSFMMAKAMEITKPDWETMDEHLHTLDMKVLKDVAIDIHHDPNIHEMLPRTSKFGILRREVIPD